ncbi:putative chloramphenicol acetyltransferase-like domain superfamily [Helianthus annuus]|nr:putative chloramphenicol acetyltransferase-like domain superfamily [Helianthus annuus]
MSRPVGGTEHSWCRAVPGGTGVTVSAILLSKPPNLPHLQSLIHQLQSHHPILRSKLHFNPTTNTYSFSDFTPPTLQIHTSDHTHSFYQTLEQEMNTNPWNNQEITETDVMFASLYNLPNEQWAVVLRLHTAVCDRVAATGLMRELVGLMGGGEMGVAKEEGLGVAIEDCVPAGKANKPFWARGADMIGYSVNAFRFSNLEFAETGLPDSTRFVRLKIGVDETDKIVNGCKAKGVKLFGALAAAGFIAARASKSLPDEKWEKYSLATLIDCRSELDPVLSDHHVGFYHSAILNSHDIKGGEDLWDVAQKIYTSLTTAKSKNKHFTDMADLNFLMCKAIENPGLTPSSSLRTSLISVFEEPVTENANQIHQEIGLLDYVGCASVHGVSPSLAIFDSIRDGELDCACVYPSPTHSREQMQDLVDHMKKILVECSVPQ